MKLPYFEVDLNANAVYIHTGLGEVYDTQQVTPGINADYDADGNVIGIEFLSAVMDFGEEFRFRFTHPDNKPAEPSGRTAGAYEKAAEETELL
jgi:uncharacterized protein YuzE